MRLWRSSSWRSAVCAAGLSAILVALVLKPWEYPPGHVFWSGNDWLWQQAVLQMHADGGPWGATDHLSWPIGANAWRLPQFGLAVGVFGWVVVGWFGVGTAGAALWFLVAAAALNAVSMVYLLRRVALEGRQPLIVALAVATSATVWLVTHHFNNGFFAVLPITFGVLIAATGRLSPRFVQPTVGELVLVAVFALLAPLWWVVVLMLAVPFVAVGFLVRRRWSESVTVACVWGAVAVAGLAQIALHVVARRGGPGVDTTRQPWESNVFAGHLTDVLVGSPLVRRLAPAVTDRLVVGASLDVGYGLPFMIGVAVVVIAVLVRPPSRSTDGVDLRVLGALSVVFVLFWLGGGLGNLQAAIAVILDSTSPARGWYRMTVPLAVLGAAWVAAFGSVRRRPVVISSIVILMIAVVDLALVGDRSYTWSPPDMAQSDGAAVDFLRQRREPCAVAVMPHEALPGGAIVGKTFVDGWLFRGMAPYVMAPEYRWSSGSYRRDDPDERDAIADLAFDMSDVDLGLLTDRGFCAVFYDRVLGSLAIEQQAPLAGRSIRSSRSEDYADDQYIVFLLDG